MNQKKIFSICCILVVVSGFVMMLCLGTLVSENGYIFIDSFAIDSFGRIYVDLNDHFYVYQDGVCLYEFSALPGFDTLSTRGVDFTITTKDEFLLLDSGDLYVLDLEGNLLRTEPSKQHSIGSGCSFITQNGDVYTKEHILGRTAIVKNETDVVFQIPTQYFVIKILLFLSAVLFCPSVLACIVTGNSVHKRHMFF